MRYLVELPVIELRVFQDLSLELFLLTTVVLEFFPRLFVLGDEMFEQPRVRGGLELSW